MNFINAESSMMPKRWIRAAVLTLLVAAWPANHVGGEEPPLNDTCPQPFADIPLYPEAANNATPIEPDAKQESIKNTESNTPSDESWHVGDLGDPQKITFEGIQLFTAAQLRAH